MLIAAIAKRLLIGSADGLSVASSRQRRYHALCVEQLEPRCMLTAFNINDSAVALGAAIMADTPAAIGPVTPGAQFLLGTVNSAAPGQTGVTTAATAQNGIGSTATRAQALAAVVNDNASVVGRFLFYDQSRYDGNFKGVNSHDEDAIAKDKSAYQIDSGEATFANVSSYSKGINGIMIDIAGEHGTIGVEDFTFKVGSDNTPSGWTAAVSPSAVTVRTGAGFGGSDRVELIWDNGAIQKTWLEVTVAANADTGLAKPDVFYFGNALADSGDGDATAFDTNTADKTAAQSNVVGLAGHIPVTNLFDFNRDGKVDANDATLAQNNEGTLFKINLITPPPPTQPPIPKFPFPPKPIVPVDPPNTVIPTPLAIVVPQLEPPTPYFQVSSTSHWVATYMTGAKVNYVEVISRRPFHLMPEEREADVLLALAETDVPSVEVGELSDVPPESNQAPQLLWLRDPLQSPQKPVEPAALSEVWPWYVALASGVVLAGSTIVLLATKRRRRTGRPASVGGGRGRARIGVR